MAEQARHTAGDWKWHWRKENGEASGSVYSEVRPGHAYTIAVTPRYQTRKQWEADARLISAAPNMLAALKEARQDLYDRLHAHMSQDEFDAHPTVAAISAAISKATGEGK